MPNGCRKVREEDKNRPNISNGITANYSTVVVANNIEGNISNSVTISEEVKSDAIDLINSIKEVVSVGENEAVWICVSESTVLLL